MVQTTERLVSTDAERYLLIYMIAVLIIVTTLVILFFIVFQKRKNKILLDKYEQKRKFERELANVQNEIQEETLKNVGRELHDNVGQLLSFASMQLSLVSSLATDSLKSKIDDTKDVVKDAIQEVRSLSKSLNNDVISNLGLRQSVQNEIDRLDKLKKMKCQFVVSGNEQEINANDSIILFRTFQEFMSNSIKYSEAENFRVSMEYTDTHLEFIAEDDGNGFDKEKTKLGSGLLNMKNRAALINAKYSLVSKPKEGVKLHLLYPLQKED